MTSREIRQCAGSLAASVVFGIAESIAVVLTAVAMVAIVVISQVVRVILESKERRACRRAHHARSFATS